MTHTVDVCSIILTNETMDKIYCLKVKYAIYGVTKNRSQKGALNWEKRQEMVAKSPQIGGRKMNKNAGERNFMLLHKN